MHSFGAFSCLTEFFSETWWFLLNMQGTISFGSGFFFVVIGWPILGMILEAYGFIVLFRCDKFLVLYFHSRVILYLHGYWWGLFCSGFWPTLSVFLQRIPILGWVFQQPFIRSVSIFWNLNFGFPSSCDVYICYHVNVFIQFSCWVVLSLYIF